MSADMKKLCPDCGCREDGYNPARHEQMMTWAQCCGYPDREKRGTEIIEDLRQRLEIAEARVKVMEAALRAAAEQFKFYAHNHYKKLPPDLEKAQTNSEWADRCVKAIGDNP